MAEYVTPIASNIGGIGFSRLGAEDIRKISVKRIHATPALDSMFGPVPGGLHDPALGAIQTLNISCSTCRLNAIHCKGHPGHIELPRPCYHPQYLDTTLRLLRSTCVYCYHFRPPQNVIHNTMCELKLLHYGLLNDLDKLARYRLGSKRKKNTQEDGEPVASDSDEDVDDLIERREKFVERCIRRSKKENQGLSTILQNPTAIARRKEVIANFIRDVALYKQCSRCKGFTPPYRKAQNTKIFRIPLAPKQRETMQLLGMTMPNALILYQNEQKEKAASRKTQVNGDKEGHMDTLSQKHGAEEEIAMANTLETTAMPNNAKSDIDDSQKYMTPVEVHAALSLLFDREQEVISMLFSPISSLRSSHVKADMFFIEAVLVPPNRFRPLARQGANEMLENSQNGILNKIIVAGNTLRQMVRESRKANDDPTVRRRTHADRLAAGIVLQEAVNSLIDSPPATAGRQPEPGIKQELEKKEGLFRMHMMGKRVNYAARSVISPDPNIETNEIGVPMVFAKKLSYPEPVTSHNVEELSRAVINGNDRYPGASAIESETGMVLNLKRKSPAEREALAKQLLTTTVSGVKGSNSKKVYRHLQAGDVVIMNRQPTLHKPSMMGHRVRVLKNEKTIRMHYANCNTYNADFDGDEMNMHFPQNELSRSEALQIADTDHQYLSATAGKPLRGLIQDHISMGVQFTNRDIFFDRDQYQELLYSCLRPEDYNTIFERIRMTRPAILKPKMLWTGKQIITTILMNIVPERYQGLNLTSKSSTSSTQWGESTLRDPAQWGVTKQNVAFCDTEQVVIFKDGEHLCGILDKSQLGPSIGGLVHSVYELYGHVVAGRLLTTIGRLLTRVLNERAWSCGMDDLYLTQEGENKRKAELSKARRLGFEISADYVTVDPKRTEPNDKRMLSRLESVLRDDSQLNGLDQVFKAKTKSITDNVSKQCLPAGLRKPFPRNQMQAMTLSGAKGSNVNANLISCNLGQQVLEGRRVPIMVSGKTLPSFRAFETHPTAGGYVCGRFLTGITPQEYFFHAMSGREGLIDTAVKTAKSGYLQRCIVKGLEGLRTEYDTSVRETSTGSMVQFLYGEDGLEVTKQKHLQEFGFLAENYATVAVSMKAEEVLSKVVTKDFAPLKKEIRKQIRAGQAEEILTDTYRPNQYLGSTSESFDAALSTYIKKNPDKLIRDKKAHVEGVVGKKTFQTIMELKYMKSIVDAGEAVGVVAAQSVGEPSTQMTLNTFHLAGHSAKNVTLGIPRLREIIMTASPNIMTPTMTLKPTPDNTNKEAEEFARSISILPLAYIIDDLSITEATSQGSRLYKITINFYNPEEYEEEHGITTLDVSRALERQFLPILDKLIKNELKKKRGEFNRSQVTAAVPDVGASVGRIEEARMDDVQTENREGGEDDIDEDADLDDAKDAAARRRREDTYDEPDDAEEAMIEETDAEDSEYSETEGTSKRRRASSPADDSSPEDDSDVSDSGEDSDVARREKDAKDLFKNVTRFRFSKHKGKKCEIDLAYDRNLPKLLLLPILEKCARTAVLRSVPGLKTCVCSMEPILGPDDKPIREINPESGKEEDKKEPIITTEGVNLLAMRKYQETIDPHTMYTNSVHEMLHLYGVEAARATIVREIDSVFKGHGISVDQRHINLLADAMTQSGSYQAFSRHGLVKEGGSVLAKMSFETVMGFLKDAVLFGESDPLLGPSARIVAGRRGLVGTGSFDVVLPVS